MDSSAQPGGHARIEPGARDVVESVWRERWGVPIVTPFGIHHPEDVEAFCLRASGGAVLGLVTWRDDPAWPEIVSLDALVTGRGDGWRLLAEAERVLRARGRRAIRLVTSNDNARALAFYQRHGYRLVRLHLGAVDATRRAKRGIPLVGIGGIPLRDLWEMQKAL